MEDEDPTTRRQKIIPDGYPEMIFHYGAPYRIDLGAGWRRQSAHLLAGQIRRHFFLENTGRSGMIGVKLFPTAVRRLYGISSYRLTDHVVDMREYPVLGTDELGDRIRQDPTHDRMLELLHAYFTDRLEEAETAAVPAQQSRVANRAVTIIVERQGVVGVAELTDLLNVGERQLERIFREYVGLSPKFFSRIIRFNAIFRLKQQGAASWTDLVHRTGYYDQSHFIRNFKEFTGEDPTAYLFEDENMANFFLNRTR